MRKRERNHAIRTEILKQLNKHGPMNLRDLSVRVGELRQVVQGNIRVMEQAGEVQAMPKFYVTFYVAREKRTAPLKGKPLGRYVNIAGSKQAIPNQCADYKSPGPRQTTTGKLFGLL
jgi:hypothetical protein